MDGVPDKKFVDRYGPLITKIVVRLPQARAEPWALGEDPILERCFIDGDHRDHQLTTAIVRARHSAWVSGSGYRPGSARLTRSVPV